MIELLIALILNSTEPDEHADVENSGDIYCSQLLSENED